MGDEVIITEEDRIITLVELMREQGQARDEQGMDITVIELGRIMGSVERQDETWAGLELQGNKQGDNKAKVDAIQTEVAYSKLMKVYNLITKPSGKEPRDIPAEDIILYNALYRKYKGKDSPDIFGNTVSKSDEEVDGIILIHAIVVAQLHAAEEAGVLQHMIKDDVNDACINSIVSEVLDTSWYKAGRSDESMIMAIINEHIYRINTSDINQSGRQHYSKEDN